MWGWGNPSQNDDIQLLISFHASLSIYCLQDPVHWKQVSKMTPSSVTSSFGPSPPQQQNLTSARTWKDRTTLCSEKHQLCQFAERWATRTCWLPLTQCYLSMEHSQLSLLQTNLSPSSGQISGEVISKASFMHLRWLSWRFLFS